MKALIDAEEALLSVQVQGVRRVCSTCYIEKDLAMFDINQGCSEGRTRQCKECRAEKTRKWYSDNRERRQEESNNRNQRRRDWCIEQLGGKCVDCGGGFHRSVYDFHHRDPGEKVDAISNLLRSPDKLEEELKKCDLLCANCHRIRHFEEGKVHESID